MCITEQDKEKNQTVIYANFQGKNPTEEKVEINVRRNCFMPSKTGVNYITFSGFDVSKAATDMTAGCFYSGRYDRSALVEGMDY